MFSARINLKTIAIKNIIVRYIYEVVKPKQAHYEIFPNI